jgi:hypothetical protein
MKLSKVLVISFFAAASLVASSVLGSAQTPTRKRSPATRVAEKPAHSHRIQKAEWTPS